MPNYNFVPTKLGEIYDELFMLRDLFSTLSRSEEAKQKTEQIPFGGSDIYLINFMDSKLEKELEEIENLQKYILKYKKGSK